MPRAVIYKPGTERFNDERLAALDELADLVAEVGFDVERCYREQLPGARGVTWWEVVYIYFGMKALDTATSRVFDASLDRVVTAAKTWARTRLLRTEGSRPEYFAVLDQEGKIPASWKITKGGAEEELTAEDGKRPLQPPPPDVPLE